MDGADGVTVHELIGASDKSCFPGRLDSRTSASSPEPSLVIQYHYYSEEICKYLLSTHFSKSNKW